MQEFSVWAPTPKQVRLQVDGVVYPMEGPSKSGYWKAAVEPAHIGSEYGYLLDDESTPLPDPRSLAQPNGVHGLSAVYDRLAYQWHDPFWQGPPLTGAVIYELHIGTFTPEGTFDAAIAKLPYLYELGITHVEVMPIVEAAGDRGWGYDGVALYAVTQHYGGADAFKRFVDACHGNGIAVILDVVYNHFGPVGNYTGKFGPYTTDQHHTPWGVAVNLERSGSDAVRQFFLDNAMMWMREFHVDGLRLDAIHEMWDRSAVHFLEQLSADTDNLSAQLGRRLVLIAESDLNDPKIVRPIEANGYGMDAQWADDFHHALATILFTDPGHAGYYDDFGAFESLAKAMKDIFVFEGQFSKYRNHSHGRPIENLSAHHFINFLQNHDQVGNRAFGDRIHETIGLDKTKIGLGLILTAPMVPMLFMGEEYAASTPFLYFADHEDPEMAKLVAAGRKKEFASFGFDSEEIPNPEDPESFAKSKLNWDEINEGLHADMLNWVKTLIAIRRTSSCLNDGDRGHLKVSYSEEHRWLRTDRRKTSIFANFGDNESIFPVTDEHRVLAESKPTRRTEGHVIVPALSLAILSTEEP